MKTDFILIIFHLKDHKDLRSIIPKTSGKELPNRIFYSSF